MLIKTSVFIGDELFQAAKKNGVRFSDAMRAGISLLLAEQGVEGYDNNLNIVRRMRKTVQILEEKAQELEKIKENMAKNEKI